MELVLRTSPIVKKVHGARDTGKGRVSCRS
jgi:hypothetical protein